MLMRGVIGNGPVCGCPAPRNHMKLASPLVRVLSLYVARYCLRGPLIDLSRENVTGQPARVKHCCTIRLRCLSRFTRRRRLHLAFAHVRPTPGRPHPPSVPKRCCSLRRAPAPAATWMQTWCWSVAQSNDPLCLRLVQPLARDTSTHPRAAAHSFSSHPGWNSSQAELLTTFFPLVWVMFMLYPSCFTG
jgi:hypothetical protein